VYVVVMGLLALAVLMVNLHVVMGLVLMDHWNVMVMMIVPMAVMKPTVRL
jgi:hypothetical protein